MEKITKRLYRICAVWFLVSTFSMIRSRRPSALKMKVLRSVPMLTLPYSFFSPQAPKAWSISVVGSLNSGKGRLYFSLNLICEAWLSLLTP